MRVTSTWTDLMDPANVARTDEVTSRTEMATSIWTNLMEPAGGTVRSDIARMARMAKMVRITRMAKVEEVATVVTVVRRGKEALEREDVKTVLEAWILTR
jgi:hypothetical protein